jgi:plastocyanin
MRRAVKATLLAAIAVLCVAPLELPSATASVAPPPSRLLVTGREYSLTLSRARINPGDAILQFLNSGEDSHDLVLKRFGRTRTFGAGETAPGDVAQFDANLSRGQHYVLYCSLADHKALGMKAFLAVRRHRR